MELNQISRKALKKTSNSQYSAASLHPAMPVPNRALYHSKASSEAGVSLPASIKNLVNKNRETLKKHSTQGQKNSITQTQVQAAVSQIDRIVLQKHYSSRDTYEILTQEEVAIPRYIVNSRDPYFKIRAQRLLGGI